MTNPSPPSARSTFCGAHSWYSLGIQRPQRSAGTSKCESADMYSYFLFGRAIAYTFLVPGPITRHRVIMTPLNSLMRVIIKNTIIGQELNKCDER